MFGFGDTYLNPYAVALKASEREIGLFSSLPSFIASLAQLKAPELTNKLGRKRTFIIAVFLHALMWLPILLVPYLFKVNVIPWFIFFVILYNIFGTISGPAWASIMTQYIPEKSRGKYFGFRNKSLGYVMLAASFAAGIILYLSGNNNLYGFTLIFAVAMLCRFASWYYLSKMYEPPLFVKNEPELTFKEFLFGEKEKKFRDFVIFSALMSFSVMVAVPFFPAYMLRELKFDYISYVIVNTAVMLFMFFSLSSWGKHADKFGNITVLRVTSGIIPVLPVLWLLSDSKIFLFGVNALAGFAWAGFSLSTSNYIFDSAPEHKRVKFLAYFSLVNGIGLFLGPLAGGFLIPHLPEIDGSKFLTVFLLSGITRFFVWIALSSRLKEIRNVSAIGHKDLLFSVLGYKPLV